jgi:TATA-box binding protein (TBP) (component of TFIID and TFIIIB)
VGQWFSDSGVRFKAMFYSFAKTNETLKNFTPRKCTISTMTLCGKLDSEINVKHVFDTLKNADIYTYGITVPMEKPLKKGKSGTADFYNQMEVKAGTVSIKLFSNGSIHLTGGKSPIHFMDIMDRVCMALGMVMDETPALESASIEMINANFSAARILPLSVLRKALEDAGHAASYDPESYAGINAKIAVHAQVVTVVIFTTGSIIITGAKSPEHVSNVYNAVCIVIDTLELSAAVGALGKVSPAVLDTYTIVDGYSSRIAHLCMN